MFATKEDPGYAKLRAVVEDAKSMLDADPRFDMPRLCPNPEYIREMKRDGILPKDVDPARQRIDPYATDRRYWALDWTDLISEQLILPPKYSLPNNLVSARFAAMNAKPKVAYEGSFSSGARTLNHINCICLTIEEMVKRMPFQEDIVIRPVLPAQTYVYGLAYRQPGTLSAGERLFVDYIAERAEQEREKENKSAE